MRKRYYFDYNIYEEIRKGKITIPNEFLRNNDIFLSVSHIEEYYKAYKNDLNNENRDNLQNLKTVMIELSKEGVILNPQKNGKIIAKSQFFEACFDVIQKYDTCDIIDNHGEKRNVYEKEQAKELQNHDKTTKNNSNLNRKEIWNRAEVIEKIEDFQNKYQNYVVQLIKELLPVYGIVGTIKAIPVLPKDFKLQKDCFKNNIPNFSLLEYVIEYLSNILGECGYCRDKEIRKTKSGIYDVTHSIYATYCNYLITQDKMFGKRAQAIYYYLGINTEVLLLDDFINNIKEGLL